MSAVRALLTAGLTVGILALSVGNAAAYGPDHVYQLTFALNCDNKTSQLCTPQVFGLGGFWGWIELDGTSTAATSGTYDAQFTGCNHLTGTQAGASHASVSDAPWAILSSSAFPPGAFAVGVDPNDRYLVPFGTGLAFPVTPGHYSISFGPGITAQSTVALMN
jgi:hypothetical protein